MCYLLLRRWFALYACHSYGKQPSSTEWRGLKFCVCIFGDPSMWNLCGFLWRVSVVLIPLSEGRGRLLLSHLGRRGNQRACGWLAAWDKGWMRLGCLARRGYRGIREGLWEGGCWVAQPSHILAWGGHRTPKHARYIHATSPLPPTVKLSEWGRRLFQ